MVFNLEIQSANVPRKPFTIVAKVSGREYLVNRPVIGERMRIVWQRVFCAFNNVGRLKYDGEHEPGDVVHNHDPHNDLPPRQGCKNERYDKDVPYIEHFCRNQPLKLPQVHPFYFRYRW